MLSVLIWWIIVGLIAGWAAGKIMKGGGYGPLMDTLLGMVGAVLVGWIFNALGFIQQAVLLQASWSRLSARSS